MNFYATDTAAYFPHAIHNFIGSEITEGIIFPRIHDLSPGACARSPCTHLPWKRAGYDEGITQVYLIA